ncbi:MFS transporter [Actinopolymorpha sp. B11F2]|uniref:MFS transporter n=1 Tax=Actinopolymorpha sp. B11F2 TaxID=3160862 RepID=UPI0032E3F351
MGPASSAPTPDGAESRRLRGVLAAAALAMFCVQLDFFALTLALPRMASDLRVTTTDLQWALSGYMLALGAFLVLGGRLGDIFGRRLVLVVGIGIFGAAAVLCALAPTAGLLIAFRILQGIGAALIFPMTVSVLSSSFPEKSRGRAIGQVFGLAAVGTALGPFVGGLLTAGPGWRWIFWFLVPFVVAAAVVTLIATRESRDESMPRRLDLAGAILLSAGVGLVTYAVDRIPTSGLASPLVWATGLAGLALLVSFPLVEGHVRLPLIDMGLFRNIAFVLVTAVGTMANVAYAGTVFLATLYLQDVRGLGPLTAGLVFLGLSVATGFAGPLAGWLGARYSARVVMTIANSIGGLSLLALTFSRAWGAYVPVFCLCGLGFGLGWSFANIGTQRVVRPERSGEAAGVTQTVLIVIAGIGLAATATTLEALQSAGHAPSASIEVILRVLAGGLLLSAALLGAFGRHAR